MKNIKNLAFRNFFFAISVFVFTLGITMTIPARTQAFDFFDPMCHITPWDCDNDDDQNSQSPRPTVSITANPISVSYNGSSVISWSSTYATICDGTGGSNGWPGGKTSSGNFGTGPLTNATTYYITCSNSSGSASASVTINVTNPITTLQLTADSYNVAYNGDTMIRWNSTNANSCNGTNGANGWSGSKSTSGTFNTGALTNTTTFNISCTNGSSSVNKSVTITVTNQVQNPTVSISANPTSVSYNGGSTLSWSSSNATSCSASGGTNGWSGSKSTSGTFNTGALTNTTTYYITCTNNTGSANNSVTINVDNQVQNPTVSINADDSSIDENDRTIIRWSSSNATSCNATGGTNGWSGNISTSGSFNTGNLSNSVTYSITCTNNTGSDSDSVRVVVDEDDNDDNERRPDINLSASQKRISSGNSTYIRWDPTEDPDFCTAKGGTNGWSGSRNTSGGNFYTGPIYSNTTYRMTCENDAGSRTESVTITVDDENISQTTVSISADRTNIGFNENTIIRWHTNNATSCFSSGGSNGWAGTRNNFSDSFNTGPLPYTTIYTISCSNYNGSHDTKSVTVNVGTQIVVQPTSTNLVATTQPASSVGNTGAEINSIIYNDVNSSSRAWFEWGTNTSLINKTTVVSIGNSPTVRHTNTMKGLVPGTTYYFRAVAQNSFTRSNGPILNFTTTGIRPTINTTTVVTTTDVVDDNPPADSIPPLGANVIGSGFFPTSILGWFLLVILLLILLLLGRHLYSDISIAAANRQSHRHIEHTPDHL